MYGSIKELTELAKKESVPIWKIILDTEMKITECSEEQVYDKLDKRYEVMYKSVHKALQEPQVITGNLISGSAKKQYEYSEQQDTLGGFLIMWVHTIMQLLQMKPERCAEKSRCIPTSRWTLSAIIWTPISIQT